MGWPDGPNQIACYVLSLLTGIHRVSTNRGHDMTDNWGQGLQLKLQEACRLTDWPAGRKKFHRGYPGFAGDYHPI